jgi:hypothetical protein
MSRRILTAATGRRQPSRVSHRAARRGYIDSRLLTTPHSDSPDFGGERIPARHSQAVCRAIPSFCTVRADDKLKPIDVVWIAAARPLSTKNASGTRRPVSFPRQYFYARSCLRRDGWGFPDAYVMILRAFANNEPQIVNAIVARTKRGWHCSRPESSSCPYQVTSWVSHGV